MKAYQLQFVSTDDGGKTFTVRMWHIHPDRWDSLQLALLAELLGPPHHEALIPHDAVDPMRDANAARGGIVT